MTTLNDIIARINEQLILAESTAAADPSVSRLTGSKEKIRKYVLLRLGPENIAIHIDGLAEIGSLPAVTPLPNLPKWIRGIVNQRGEIISVIDLIMLLLPERNYVWSGSRLAVLKAGKMKAGLCVDRIIATISRPDSELFENSGSDLQQVAPQVFDRALRVNNEIYQILHTEALLAMDKFMHYNNLPG